MGPDWTKTIIWAKERKPEKDQVESYSVEILLASVSQNKVNFFGAPPAWLLDTVLMGDVQVQLAWHECRRKVTCAPVLFDTWGLYSGFPSQVQLFRSP